MTKPELYPDVVARFYDVIYARIRSSVDHDYYLEKARRAGGAVLEVGVGTGRLFLEALNAHVDVHGLDVSPSMINVLQNKLAEPDRRRVQVGDVRTFADEGRYDLILAPFRVLGHLTETADQLLALSNMRRHLTDDGRLIFDVFVPNPVLCHQGLAPTVDFDGEWSPGQKLRRTMSVTARPFRQINLVSMLLEWEEDGQWRRHQWEFPMRYFYRYELEHLVARAGLVLESMTGDFHNHPVGADSRDFVLIGHKPK